MKDFIIEIKHSGKKNIDKEIKEIISLCFYGYKLDGVEDFSVNFSFNSYAEAMTFLNACQMTKGIFIDNAYALKKQVEV